MRVSRYALASSLIYALQVHAQRSLALQKSLPSLPLGLWSHLNALDLHDYDDDAVTPFSSPKYPAHTLQVPIDHFSYNDTSSPVYNRTFGLRFWYDATHYEPGGAVFCLDGGETSGSNRLEFLDHGILNILARETGGLAVVLEHRYYGHSFPVDDLSTDNLRWLTTHQALADNAYFTKHATFPALDGKLAKAVKKAPWIHYGGSYAGAKVALLRKIYPETVFGAIASSAVTEAVVDYWKYFEAIRLHAPQDCVSAIEQSISLIDTILASGSKEAEQQVKDLLGLHNITHIEDAVSLLTYPLGAWQARNWDPSVSSTGFDDFCADLLGRPSLLPMVQNGAQRPLVHLQAGTPSAYLASYAKFIRENVVLPFCKPPQTHDECFGTFDAASYERHDLKQTWRAWTWQYCTEWGFLQRAAPEGVPSLLSRKITLEYTHMICKLAFPDGKHSKVPSWPNTTIINQYGGFSLAEDRIAFIDGSDDPWIYATPHSPDVKQRANTLSRPFEIIKGGVHHWDENGLDTSDSKTGKEDEQEPPEIARIHMREVEFVKSWLEEGRKSGEIGR